MVDIYLDDGTKITADWAGETAITDEFGTFIPDMTADDAIRAFLDNMSHITVVDGSESKVYDGYNHFKIVSDPGGGGVMLRLKKDE